MTHLLLQQGGEVFPETLLEVIAPRLSLLLLWTHRDREEDSLDRKHLLPPPDRGKEASPGSSVSLKAGRRAVGPGGGSEDRGSSWKHKTTS